jgi:hypothetical protein
MKIAAALVLKYSEYINKGVVEPYASQLLFSTETRKEISDQIEMSQAHINNTLPALAEADVLLKEGKTYLINPQVVPVTTLIFKFKVNGSKG